MAQQFNLTAQINLQSPKNVGRVVADIQRQLKGKGLNTVNIKVKADPRTLAQTNKQLQSVGKNSRNAAKDISILNSNLREAARRFSVITVATGTLLGLVTGLKNATKAAIEFEREIIKISQVTGKSVQQLQGLTKEVTRLSTTLGVSSADILNVSRVLSQAGFAAEKTRKALEILAQTSLGATFNNIQDTTEGAIALLRQFSDEAKAAGGDIAFLEKSLSAINSVSKKFAVESGDLITVIRRVGGVFSAAGGSVNELIALFTSVRATTRESAETIATGLRTIFTRIQRTETIDQLRSLNIHLQDSKGQFVGAFEAVKRLSHGLSALNPKDFRFSEIVEQLGGFRQIGKVIPLIQQFAVAQDALSVAQGASGSVAKDAATAQQGLGVQITKVKEEFTALIRKFTDSGPFNTIATGALKIASAMIKVMEAVEPLIPLLTTMFMMKIGRSLAPGIAGMAGMARRGGGGPIGVSKFAKGGVVPGSGNRDTVPAMLTPGEFVIRKSSVKKLGAGRLAQMNNNRYKHGGGVLENSHLSTGRSVKITKHKGGKTYNAQTLDNLVMALPREINQALKGKSKGNVSGHKLHAAIQSVPAQTLFRGQLASKRGGYGDLKKFPEAQQQLSKNVETYKRVALSAINKEKVYHHDKDLIKLGNAIKKKASPELKKALSAVNEVVVKRSENKVLPPGMRGRSERRVRVASKDTLAKRASGGLIQKLALGGIATKNKVGFAVLDPDQGGGDKDATVTRAQVRAGVTGTKAQKQALDKELSWSSKTYKLATQGLPQKTSQRFYDTITEGAVTGVENAASSLSSNLGQGAISMPKDAKATMQQVIKKSGSQMGSLFEQSLNVIDNKGAFKPTPVGAPWDFKNGLQGGLKNTYNKMPSSFVDARTSYSRSTPAAAQGKIINELVDEYEKRTGAKTYKSATKQKKVQSASVLAEQGKRRAKQQAKMAKEREAAGFAKGGAAPSDTVPALLTPGEFVINKSAASSIGRGNLDRMNKKGVTGFAAGGVVTSGRHAYGDVGPPVTLGQAHLDIPDAGGIPKFIESIEQGTKTVEKGTKTDKKNTDQTNKQTNAFQKLKDTTQKFSARMAGGAEKVQKMASSAQGFVFLGASIAAVTSQMSGLDDSTKTAINETAGFATGIVGIGATVIDTFSSMIIANSLQAESSGAVTRANITQAASQSGGKVGDVAAGGGKVIKALSGFAIGLAIGVTALKFNSAKNKAIANEMKEDMHKALTGIKEGVASDTSALKESVKKEIETRNRASAQISSGAIATVAVGAAAGAAAGAAIGSAVPVFGTVIGGIIGGIVGFAGAMGAAEAGMYGEITAREKEVQAIYKTIDSIVALNQAQHDLKTGLAAINETPGLTEPQQVERRLNLDMGVGADKEFLESQATLKDIGDKLGKDPSQIKESDFEAGWIQGPDNEGLKAFETATLQASAAAATMEARLKMTSETFNLALKNSDPTKTFDELRHGGGNFQKAIEAQIRQMEERTSVEVSQAKKSLDATKKGSKERTSAQDFYDKAVKRGADALTNLESGAEAVHKIKVAEAAAIRLAIDAQVALAKSIIENSQYFSSLNRQMEALDRQSASLSNFGAALDGAAFDFGKIEIKGLGDITNIDDIGEFTTQLRDATKDAGPQAQKFADQLIENVEAFKKGNETLVGMKQPTGEEAGADANKKILNEAGFSVESLGGGVLGELKFEEMMGELTKAFDDGIISPEDVKNIFKPAEEANAQAIKSAKILNDKRQKEVDNFGKYLSVKDKLRGKEIEIRERSIDAIRKGIGFTEKADETLSKSIDPDADFNRQRGVETQLQNVNAQNRLNNLGMGLQAGNFEQVGDARRDAQAKRENLRKLMKENKIKGSDVEGLMEADNRLKNIIETTGDELKRLSDRTSEAADIQSEMDQNLKAIQKERQAREQVTGVIEDFVIGGKEARKGLVQAAAGVRQAFTTGTLQMQTPEQRSATVGLLDKLGDVQLAGGMTGKEIKKQLVFQDAIKLGLDPKIAEAIANGTSTEEKLIEANKNLASKMEQLTMAMLLASMQIEAPSAPKDPRTESNNLARGGAVYKAGGGSIFKPRGTDTVPAMLSPGEFVIRKSAVDSIGVDNLAAMNDGVAYRKTGSEKPEEPGFFEDPLLWMLGGKKKRPPKKANATWYNDSSMLGDALDLANIPGRLGVPEEGMFDGKFIAEGLRPYGSGQPSGQELMDQRAGFQARRDAGAMRPPSGQDMRTTTSPAPRTMASINYGGPMVLGQLSDEIGAAGSQLPAFASAAALPQTIADAGFDALGTKVTSRNDFVTDPFYEKSNLGKLGDFTFKKGEENIKAAEQERLANVRPADAGMYDYLTVPGATPNPTQDARINRDKKDREAERMQAQDGSLERGIAGVNRMSEVLRAQRIADGTSTETHPLTGKPLTNVNADHLFELGPVAGFGVPNMGEMGQALKDQDAARAIGSTFDRPDYLGGSGSDDFASDWLGGSGRGGASWRFGTPQGLVREGMAAGDLAVGSMPGIIPGLGAVGSMMGTIPDRPEQDKAYETWAAEHLKKPTAEENAKKTAKHQEDARKRKVKWQAQMDFDDQEIKRKTAAKNKGTFMDPEVRAKKAAHNKKQNEGHAKRKAEEATREDESAYMRNLEKDDDKRFNDKYKAGEDARAAMDSNMMGTEQEQINDIIREGGSSTDVSNFLKYGSAQETGPSALGMGAITNTIGQASYTDRQTRVMGRSAGVFGGGEDVGAIGKFGLDMKFDSEGILVARDAPDKFKPKPMASTGTPLTKEQRQTAANTRADRNFNRREAAGERAAKEEAELREAEADENLSGAGSSRFLSIDQRKANRAASQAKLQKSASKKRQARGRASRGMPTKDTGVTENMTAVNYQRILRTQGQRAAFKYASRVGYEPPGLAGSPRGQGRRGQGVQQGAASTTDQLLQQLLRQVLGQQGGNRGGVMARKAAGGGIGSGSDVIPAMLTPGEFVMSAGAVRQHGVGAMKSLNRGRVPGFNRGGSVGGVAYLNGGGPPDGGGFSIDTTELTKTFSNFISGFSAEMGKITGGFESAAGSMEKLAKVLGAGFNWTHDHRGTVNLSGAVTQSLSPETIQEIRKIITEGKGEVPNKNEFEAP